MSSPSWTAWDARPRSSSPAILGFTHSIFALLLGMTRLAFLDVDWMQESALHPSGVSAGLGAIVLPLIGFILLTRPDSRWYFMR